MGISNCHRPNLASIHYEPPVPAVAQTLNAIGGRYDRVLGETGAYIVNQPAQYQTLTELHPALGYYLHISATTTANALIEGVSTPVTAPLSLHQGWNWIGYLPRATWPLTLALQSIDGNYQRVLSLDKTYDVSLPQFSTLHTLEAGQGYLLYATQAVSLTYPAGAPPTRTMDDKALEDLDRALCAARRPTPFFNLAYGGITVNGAPAAEGVKVEALTPRGDVAGCFVVQKAGQFGLMHVYGEDQSVTPPIPGFRPGEPLAFRVNGLPATMESPAIWQDNWTPQQSLLTGIRLNLYLPLVLKGE